MIIYFTICPKISVAIGQFTLGVFRRFVTIDSNCQRQLKLIPSEIVVVFNCSPILFCFRRIYNRVNATGILHHSIDREIYFRSPISARREQHESPVSAAFSSANWDYAFIRGIDEHGSWSATKPSKMVGFPKKSRRVMLTNELCSDGTLQSIVARYS